MKGRCIQDRNGIKQLEVRGSPFRAVVIDRKCESTRFPFNKLEHFFPDQAGVVFKTVAQAIHQKFAILLWLGRQLRWDCLLNFF